MGERNAKKIKKENQTPVVKPKKTKAEKIFIIVMIVVFVAVIGLGGWAIGDKIVKERALNAETEAQEQAPMTVEQIALEEELSVDEFLKKLGLENAGLTAESTADEFLAKMTIESFAKFEGMDVSEFKKEYQIEDLADDMPWNEASMKIKMSVLAEKQYGMSFEEFAAQSQLPAEITADTTQGDAVAIMQAQMAE